MTYVFESISTDKAETRFQNWFGMNSNNSVWHVFGPLGDPILSHLERLSADPALHLHTGETEPEHLWSHLHAVCVAGRRRGTKLHPGLQHLKGHQTTGLWFPVNGQLHPCPGWSERIPNPLPHPTEDLQQSGHPLSQWSRLETTGPETEAWQTHEFLCIQSEPHISDSGLMGNPALPQR